MTGLGGLDETGDGGEGGGLEGGSWNRVMIGGGRVGDGWAIEGVSRVTSGSDDGTGGGTRVGIAGCFRCEAGVRSAVVMVRIRSNGSRVNAP